MRYTRGFFGLLICGACSSAGVPTQTLAPFDTDAGGSAAEVTRDATGAVTVTVDGTELAMGRLPLFDNDSFLAYQGTVSRGSGLFLSETDTSRVAVFRPDHVTFNGGPTVALERTAPAEIPTRGSATITGPYQGIAQAGTLSIVEVTVVGDGRVDVDFTAGTVSGAITNREPRDPERNLGPPFDGGSATLADLTLDPSTIDGNGSFSGTTSDGEFTYSFATTTTVTTGTYNGILAGTGDEALVGIVLDHDFGFGGLLEVGAIAGGH